MVEEGARLRRDLNLRPLARHRQNIQSPHRRVGLAPAGAEGGEVVAPHQVLGGAVHGLMVEDDGNVPGMPAVEGQRRPPIDDAIAIMAAGGRNPGVEVAGDPLGLKHGNGGRFQVKVDGIAHGAGIVVLGQIQMGHLAQRMDAGIGNVLAELDRLGLRDRTLVIFSSDNGGHTYSSNEPLSGEKATLWEGGIRVPCIARWPGVLAAGSTTSLPCITMDWTATFRRLAGYTADSDREDGIDLLPYLTGKQKAQPRPLFWRRKSGPIRRVKNPGRAVRRGKWKLLEMGDGERYLFDLSKDIAEKENLIDKYPDLARDLSNALDAWEASVAN